MNEQTPKQFVLQIGSLACLYLSVTFILVLLFGLINLFVPDVADSYYSTDSNQSQIRFSIAMLVVFFPTYLYLTRKVNVFRRQTANAAYVGLTRWLLYLSLLAAGFAILIDIVALIMAFLEGELTVRFLLKILSVLLVVGLAFIYYVKDVKGYWLENERESKIYASLAALIVLIAIVFGFLNIETPESVRLAKIDNEIVSDLQDMQWRIEDYYRSNSVLPDTIPTLYGTFEPPVAPEGLGQYRYEVTSDREYKLCAEFNQASQQQRESYARPMFEKNYNWEHTAGDWCFERLIDDVYRQ